MDSGGGGDDGNGGVGGGADSGRGGGGTIPSRLAPAATAASKMCVPTARNPAGARGNSADSRLAPDAGGSGSWVAGETNEGGVEVGRGVGVLSVGAHGVAGENHDGTDMPVSPSAMALSPSLPLLDAADDQDTRSGLLPLALPLSDPLSTAAAVLRGRRRIE